MPYSNEVLNAAAETAEMGFWPTAVTALIGDGWTVELRPWIIDGRCHGTSIELRRQDDEIVSSGYGYRHEPGPALVAALHDVASLGD